MTTYTPTDASGLSTALSSATSGDFIDLAANTISGFTGEHTLAAGVTLTGTVGSAKIQITDTGSNYETITMGAGAIIENIQFEHPNAPDAGTLGNFTSIPSDFRAGNTHTAGVDYVNHVTIRSTSDDIIIRNCAFLGYVNHFIELQGAEDALVDNCLLQGGHWALVLLNSCDRFHLRDSIIAFTNGEGLKTVHGEEVPADGPVDMLLEDNWFIRCARDGADFAGGCRGLEWRGTNTFWWCGNGTDYKCVWLSDAQVANDGSLNASAREIVNTGTLHFVDCGVPQVFTALDENNVITFSPTPGNQRYWSKWAPYDIDLGDVIYEDSGNGRIDYASGQSRVMFIKSGDDISITTLSLRNIPAPNQGDVDLIDEDYDAGGSAEDDAPSGWSPSVSPSIGSSSFDSATEGLSLPTYNQSGESAMPVADSGLYRFIASAYDDTPGTPFTFIGRCEVDNQFNTSAISFPQGNWTDKVGGATPLSGLASNSKVAVIVTMKGAQGPNPSGLTIGGVTATKRADAPSPNNSQDCNTSIWEATASGSFANDTIAITGTDRSGDASAIEVFLLDSNLSFQTGLGSSHVQDGGTNDSPTLTTTCVAEDKLLGNYVCLNNDDAPGVTSGASLFPSANNPQGHPSGMRRVSFTNTNASANQAVQLTRASGVTDQAACVAVYR